MKKSKQAKKRTSKKRSLLMYQKLVKQWKKLSVKQRVLLSLAAFVILSITAYFSYAWYQGYAFRKVEKKLDALTQEIVTELGEPISQTKEQSCGYASAKFSRGRLGCGSTTDLVYNLHDKSASDSIQKTRETITRVFDSI